MIREIHHPGDPVADFLFNWLPMAGAAFAGLLGIALLVLGFNAFVKAAALRKWGIRGTAVVTGKWLKRGYVDREERNRSTALRYHYLRFERRENGRMISAKEVAPVALWDEVEPGDSVDVVYLPRGSLMRLSAWSDGIGQGAGTVQLVLGAFFASTASGMMIAGALSAMKGPQYREIGPDWVVETAEVLMIGDPADPYLRLFAPGTKYLQVVFGDTNGGALMANQRTVLVSPEQVAGLDIREGDILKAWMDPEDEYNAVLDLERDRPWRGD